MRKHHLKKLSLKKQLLVYMMLLTCIPVLFLTVFNNYYNEKAIDQQANDYTTQMLKHVRLNIDGYVQTVDRIAQYLARSESVLDYLRLDGFYDSGRIELETQVRTQMSIYLEANRELVGGILIAGENELYASNEMYRVSRSYPLNADEWYKQAAAAEGELLILSRPIGRNIRNYRNFSAYEIVSVLRAVHDPNTGEMLGVICVDMLLNVVQNQIRDITLGKEGYVFVRDASGEIVYAPVNDTVYRIQDSWFDDVPSVHTINAQRYQLIASDSKVTGWTTVGVFHMGDTLEPVAVLRRYTMLVVVMSIALATLMSIFISGMFTEPISRLRQLMRDAEEGNLEVSFDEERYSGEIRQLGSSFNNMIARIRELMQVIYKEQQDKREAEIRTLQAQIKPHFLYNTLDTIRWMSEERGMMEISRLVTALTRLFRISLSRGREIIPLRDEIEHVRSYLYIQKVRYEDKLNYEINVDEALLNLEVNKLILQPLVENAIYHGIKQKRTPGHIIVDAERARETLILRVRDDGAGMSAEKCALLNDELMRSDAKEYTHGYGIFNVNDRVRLSYGREYGLHYSINETGGITVELRCPVVEGEARIKGQNWMSGGGNNGE